MSDRDDGLQMTRADYERLEAEIEHLETASRGEMAERIKAARELGDLKENAEYHDAKDAQAILETKILRLRDQLVRAEVVEAKAASDKIGFGSTARAHRPRAPARSCATRSSRPSTPTRPGGKLSIESPVGQALVGHRAGDVVELQTPRGTRTLEVVSIC